jgi:hypothetical protein
LRCHEYFIPWLICHVPRCKTCKPTNGNREHQSMTPTYLHHLQPPVPHSHAEVTFWRFVYLINYLWVILTIQRWMIVRLLNNE